VVLGSSMVVVVSGIVTVVVGVMVVVGIVTVVVGVVVGGIVTVVVAGWVVVGPDPWVVTGPSVGGGSCGPVGDWFGMKRRTVVVETVDAGGGTVDADVGTVEGAPSRVSGGSEVVEVGARSRRGAVTGASAAASTRTWLGLSTGRVATAMVLAMATPQIALATPTMRRSRRAGWGL
jgi:hypothetical protein